MLVALLLILLAQVPTEKDGWVTFRMCQIDFSSIPNEARPHPTEKPVRMRISQNTTMVLQELVNSTGTPCTKVSTPYGSLFVVGTMAQVQAAINAAAR